MPLTRLTQTIVSVHFGTLMMICPYYQDSVKLDAELREASREHRAAEAAHQHAAMVLRNSTERRSGSSSESPFGVYAYLVLEFVTSKQASAELRQVIVQVLFSLRFFRSYLFRI